MRTLTFYSVNIQTPNHGEPVYYGPSLEDARFEFENADTSEFEEETGVYVELYRQTFQYEFVAELDPEVGDSIEDYPLEDHYEDESIWREIGDTEHVLVAQRDVAQVNASSDKVLADVQWHFMGKYGELKYNKIWIRDEADECFVGEICLRISDHTENITNIDRFGRCDAHISVVIANKDATRKRFWSNDLERRGNERELTYNGEHTAEQIIAQVEELIAELTEKIRIEKS